MISQILTIAGVFLLTYCSQSMPLPLKFVNYVFLGVALLLLVVPLGPIGPLWR